MISSSANQLKVYLCNQAPVYIGNCLRFLIHQESKDKLFVSFSYDPVQGIFKIDHEKTFARSLSKDSSAFHCQSLPLEHGKACPCYTMSMNPDIYSFQSTNTFVRLSCSTLIFDSNNQILLTRRDKKLRSFPGAWVNPGGRLDPGESLNDCALRELKEEVGIDIEVREDPIKKVEKYYYLNKQCEVKPFMVYESVYPTMLDHGLPKAQYVVIFYSVRINVEHSKIKTKIQNEEVDKAVWISLPHLMENIESKKMKSELQCHPITSNGTSHKSEGVPSETFDGIYPNSIKEGIGEGHLIALRHYYYNFLANAMNVETAKF